MEFKQELIGNLQYLYSGTIGETEENQEKFISDEQAFAEEFGWYPMLYTAANDDYLKISQVVQSPAIEFLHFVNFFKRKTELEINRIKKQS